MTNSCYSPRGVFDMYRVENPVELNLYCRKRIRNRLFYRLFRGRIYWFCHDVQHEIQHEIHEISQYRIPCVMHRIMRFMRIVCKVAKLEAPILAAVTALYVKALYCCALIALIN